MGGKWPGSVPHKNRLEANKSSLIHGSARVRIASVSLHSRCIVVAFQMLDFSSRTSPNLKRMLVSRSIKVLKLTWKMWARALKLSWWFKPICRAAMLQNRSDEYYRARIISVFINRKIICSWIVINTVQYGIGPMGLKQAAAFDWCFKSSCSFYDYIIWDVCSENRACEKVRASLLPQARLCVQWASLYSHLCVRLREEH